jgi:hypothetical protein
VSPATIYCLIPTKGTPWGSGTAGAGSESACQNEYCEGHSLTFQDVKTALPLWSQQGWTRAMGLDGRPQSYTEVGTGITREVYKVQASQPFTLYHVTHTGWQLLYFVDYSPNSAQYAAYTHAANPFAVSASPGSFAGQLQVQEMHPDQIESCGASTAVECQNGIIQHMCGPTLLQNPSTASKVHCDRDYTFGRGYERFFTGRSNLWLIQDSHDPNDHTWAATQGKACNVGTTQQAAWTDATQTGMQQRQSCAETQTEFTVITLPAGASATLHAFVPIGSGGGATANTVGATTTGGAHGANDLPNTIDPLGAWTDTGEVYMEDNCIERHRYKKTIQGVSSYQLHHTTDREWGYVYIVELNPVPEPPYYTGQELSMTDAHQNSNDCGPVLVDDPKGCTKVHCDRDYTFGDDPSYMAFFKSLKHPYLLQVIIILSRA